MTSRCACTIYIQKIYPVCTPLAQMANSYVSRLNLFSLSLLKKLMLDYKDFTVLYAIKWLIVTGHGELANNYLYDMYQFIITIPNLLTLTVHLQAHMVTA